MRKPFKLDRILLVAALLTACSQGSDLPKLFPVPDTKLIDDGGKSVNLGEMKGFVTVYDFIFTSCSGTCPLMTANMQRIAKRIDRKAAVRFVSISVDPERDTPEVLRKHAAGVRNDERWLFLTGDRDAIVRLSVEGFKLAAAAPQPGAEPILHSSKLVVADKTGVIRAYLGGTESDAPQRVAATVDDLLEE